MALTADEVVVKLRADQAEYDRRINQSTRVTEIAFNKIDRSVAATEASIRKSSGAIGSTIKGLAGSIAGYFTGRELAGLLDSFTRLQNNLRVAGLEGDNLKAAQDRLFRSAQRYGVELEGLSSLFSTLTQASKELGASQEQVFGITDAVSAALKIQGVNAQEADGALLQLGQALRGGKIQAEEYNSLIDGLYPLLEAAANGSERFGGSVAKLTFAVKNGKVSSKEFFDAILRGADVLEAKAAKAALTMSAGLTTLNNALTVYFGEADKANGVSAALGEAIGALADNLDVVIPAVAVLATGLGVGLVTSMVTARIAAGALGASLLGAFGGPVGIAITAVVVGIGYAIAKAREGTAATGEYAKATEQLRRSQEGTKKAIDDLASATGKARDQAIAAARAKRDQAKADLQAAQAALVHAKAQQELAEQARKAANAPTLLNALAAPENDPRAISDIATKNAAEADANVKAAQQRVAGLQRQIAALTAALQAPAPSASGSVDSGGTKKKRTGPTLAEIAQRQEEELSRLRIEELEARRQLATDADDRAELQREILAEERRQREAQINAEKGLSPDQRKERIRALDKLYGSSGTGENGEIVVNSGLYSRAAARDLEAERDRLSQESLQRERETLEAEADLLNNRQDQLAAQQRILDSLDREERLRLESEIASGQIAAAEAERARELLARKQSARRVGVERQNGSPLDQYRQQVSDLGNSINDQLERVQVDGLQSLNDGLVEAIMNAKSLGSVFKNVANQIIADILRIAIRQAIIAPLLGGLGGGGLSSIFGGFFAGGGSPPVGKVSVVGERGPELFVPRQAGVIVPNHAIHRVDPLNVGNKTLSRAGNGATVIQPVINVDARGAVMNDQFATMILAQAQENSVQVAAEMGRTVIRGVPARLQQFQRDGV